MTEQELLDRVTFEPNTGCWLWLRSVRGPSEYAQVSKKDDPSRIGSRAVFRMFHGDIPAGHYVLHRCDTPLCMNPVHLFSGTAKDNVDDMVRKGRRKVGVSPQAAEYAKQARVGLRAKYLSDDFRKLQGERIAEGHRRHAAAVTPTSCPVCGADVFPLRKGHRFCSITCKSKGRSLK